MKDDNQFYKDARDEFKYLEAEFGFKPIDRESHWSSYDINYEKGNIQVRIAFQWYDNMFTIQLTRTDIKEKDNKSLGELLNPDNEREFNFTYLLLDIKGIDKNKLSPGGHSDYTETMKYQARLLKEYGPDYLLGKKWPTFPDRSNQEIEIEIYQRDDNKSKKIGTKKMTTIDQLKNLLKRNKK